MQELLNGPVPHVFDSISLGQPAMSLLSFSHFNLTLMSMTRLLNLFQSEDENSQQWSDYILANGITGYVSRLF